MKTAAFGVALEKLRGVLANCDKDESLKQIIKARDTVLGRYQPVFATSTVQKLTEEQFKSFLLFENNQHWSGLNRKGHRACADMKVLRKAMVLFLDQKKPLAGRMNKVADEIAGMGKALITAILLVAHPDKYGVWNNTSEAALKALKLWPEFERGLSFGERYELVNQTLLGLAKGLGVDLWTLDALFWRVIPHENDGEVTTVGTTILEETEQRFGLERHLHEFLRDNWKKTELAHKWVLYSEQGEPEAGFKYPTDVGEIDLLATDKSKRRWLVVELKRWQSNDDTVGQILRYMGYVRKHLARSKDTVEGLIIAHEVDDKLRYAISEVPNVKLQLYEVSFKLRSDSKSKV